MEYLYTYQIKTSQSVVFKIGHSKVNPNKRMKAYTRKYRLKYIPGSLFYQVVTNSYQCEQFIIRSLVADGFRNIRDGKTGPQELLQTTQLISYKSVVKKIKGLLKKFSIQKNIRLYKASELIGGEQPSNFDLSSNSHVFSTIIKALFKLKLFSLTCVLLLFFGHHITFNLSLKDIIIMITISIYIKNL